MRRANGSGCVRKLSGNRRKPYQAIVTIKFDENGKQRYKNVGTYITRAEAEYELYKYINFEKQEKQRNTLKNIYEDWKSVKYNKIAHNTIKSYELTFNKIKDLHDYDINDLKANILQKKCDELTGCYKHFFKVIMRMIFDYAVQNDIASKNYAQYIECKKYAVRKEKKLFSKCEIEMFDKHKGDKERVVKILLYTGMRVSELLNMKRKDYIKNENLLNVDFGKTISAKRQIPIHEKIHDDIEYFYKKNNKYLITFEDENQVKYTRMIKYVSGKYNHTMHETRHTFATQCNILELDRYATKKILGHATNDITLDIYTHNEIEATRKLISKFKY